MKRALVPLANGTEEMEVVIIIDVFRRAKWEVYVAATGELQVTASRGVKLVADGSWDDIDPLSYDILAIPGGAGGTASLQAHAGVLEAVRKFASSGHHIVAAICAGPLVLQEAGILGERMVTCHPSVADEITVATVKDDPVVVDGNVITSRGPGTAFAFALACVRRLEGDELAATIAREMVLS